VSEVIPYHGDVSATDIDLARLARLADETGGKIEIDREGVIVVSPPPSTPHVVAANRLARQLGAQLPTELDVLVEGPFWATRGGSRPAYVPDLAVVAVRSLRRPEKDLGLEPPPLLVVEVLSPDSRSRDLGDKLEDYFAGGAEAYWMVAVPGPAPVDRPALEVRTRGRLGWSPPETFIGRCQVALGPDRLELDLDHLVIA